MKIKTWLRNGLIVSACLTAGSSIPSPAVTPGSGPQEPPAKKTSNDYMNTILSRNTQPLGLKEDQAVKNLMKQPRIKWIVRAASKYILD